MKPTVNDVLEVHAAENSKLRVKLLPLEKDFPSFVLFEGDANALKFLGNLLLAHADANGDGTFQMHPQGAGSLHFDEGSDIGFYLHRTR